MRATGVFVVVYCWMGQYSLVSYRMLVKVQLFRDNSNLTRVPEELIGE